MSLLCRTVWPRVTPGKDMVEEQALSDLRGHAETFQQRSLHQLPEGPCRQAQMGLKRTRFATLGSFHTESVFQKSFIDHVFKVNHVTLRVHRSRRDLSFHIFLFTQRFPFSTLRGS